MPEYDAALLLHTRTITAWDCLCRGQCRAKAGEEWSPTTLLSFPQHGVYVHSVGRRDVVADVNHVVVINEDEPYQVSHPVPGGDATLTLGVDPATLVGIIPRQYRHSTERAALTVSGLRIDATTQHMASSLRQRLSRGTIDSLEAESAALQLIRHTVGDTSTHQARSDHGNLERMADDAKLLLATDPWRRWTLSEMGSEIGVTPVYLTDAFRRVEGMPLYRYHLRMRMALALSLLADCTDLTTLAIDLGFTSHSHFTATFRRTYGLTPSAYQRSLGVRTTHDHAALVADDHTPAYPSRGLVPVHAISCGRSADVVRTASPSQAC